MDNQSIAHLLEHTGKLLELHGANTFKVKSYLNAANKIEKLDLPLAGLSIEALEQVEGVGKSISRHIYDLNEKGTFQELAELLENTPEGVRELMEIKGLGPKKTGVIWKELGIESPGELLYACNENRLIELKGFGEKTQRDIKKAIEYRLATRHLYHYARVDVEFSLLEAYISKQQPEWLLSRSGAFRRCCEVLPEARALIAALPQELIPVLRQSKLFVDESLQAADSAVNATFLSGLPLLIHCCPKDQYVRQLFEQTGCPEHVQDILGAASITDWSNITDEISIYQQAGKVYLAPELREVEQLNIRHEITLLQEQDLKGVLHCHSTWSDGEHSLEEMALACRDLGYQYLGISDHSRSAFYANGLSIERVQEQADEISKLNSKLAPFRIFHSIESDILADGSLDYPEEVLSQFDFVIASVHSGLKMDEEKATGRIVQAIRNPYTRILGHPTGRLLLARQGYPLDHKKIIDACAEEGVVIELNAHPYRLDLDWRWIQYALAKQVMISINPDAHATSGYGDVKYGVLAARKGGLTKQMTLNALNLDQFENWITAGKVRK